MAQVSSIQSVRGMRDILLPESAEFQAVEQLLEKVANQYGYGPIYLPLLEKTGLFKRTIGEETDVVSKEMYTFEDRSGENITLRPEATAGVVRAMIENGLLQQVNRVYTAGPMFRYERPQKGRYRQFNQVSIEAFGIADASLDVELIAMNAQFYRELGLLDCLKLEINTIGLPAERQRYTQALVAYLQDFKAQLDEDSQRRLTTNPLRILDSKNPQVQAVLTQAPRIMDYLGEDSHQHFNKVCQLLNEFGIEFTVNERLVRGLDYYCHTVFEWTTNELGAQGTVCAGGRYDGLVEQLGGKPTPAAGFAVGLDRTLLLAQKKEVITTRQSWIYGIAASEAEQLLLMQMLDRLRQAFPAQSIVLHADPQSLKSQLKKADKIGAKFALIIGEQERTAEQVTLKNLENGQQHSLAQSALIEFLQNKQ